MDSCVPRSRVRATFEDATSISSTRALELQRPPSSSVTRTATVVPAREIEGKPCPTVRRRRVRCRPRSGTDGCGFGRCDRGRGRWDLRVGLHQDQDRRHERYPGLGDERRGGRRLRRARREERVGEEAARDRAAQRCGEPEALRGLGDQVGAKQISHGRYRERRRRAGAQGRRPHEVWRRR